jgi:outer membrane lipoprotein-sorting protein
MFLPASKRPAAPRSAVLCFGAAFLALTVFAAALMTAAPRALAADDKGGQTAPLITLSRRDLAAVKQAETYLNGIKTLKAHFTQTAGDGTQQQGTFMLKRPGRMRFEYDGTVKDFIVADGTFIYYYDAAMKQQSNALISHSLANFFLRKDLSLSGDLSVVKVGRKGGMIYIRLVQTRQAQSGALTLVLSEKPMTLQGWRVEDASGGVTEISLDDQVTGITLDNDLFHYYDPRRQQQILNK